MTEMPAKILHIMPCSIFFKNYLEFLSENDDLSRHIFLLTSYDEKYRYIPETNDVYIIDLPLDSKNNYLFFQKVIFPIAKTSKLIITHGYFGVSYVLFCLLHQKLIQKTLWVVWGHDIVTYQQYKASQKMRPYFIGRVLFQISYLFKKYIIRKMKYVIARDSEYQIIKDLFNKNITRLNVTSLYTSRSTLVCPPSSLPLSLNKNKYNVLLGHSAFRNEKHHLWIDRLSHFKGKIQLYIVLSYGDSNYAESVASHARAVFGTSVTIVDTIMEYVDYCNFISTMDIAIMDATEQTGLGGMFLLLNCGKKVYLNPSGLNMRIANEKGYITYSTSDINSFSDFSEISNEVVVHNSSLVDCYGDYKQTILDWQFIFNEIPKRL